MTKDGCFFYFSLVIFLAFVTLFFGIFFFLLIISMLMLYLLSIHSMDSIRQMKNQIAVPKVLVRAVGRYQRPEKGSKIRMRWQIVNALKKRV